MPWSREQYNSDYGIKSMRVDRYGGEPSWLETAIREYELGVLGPLHQCGGECDCISCCRLNWLRSPICECKPSMAWGFSLSLEDAMRRKWRSCMCKPEMEFCAIESCCKCILLMTTQEDDLEEHVHSPLLNRDYYPPGADNEGLSEESSDGYPYRLGEGAKAIIERMLREGWKLPPLGYDPFTMTWVTPEVERALMAAQAAAQEGEDPEPDPTVDLPAYEDITDTASSSRPKRKYTANATSE